MIWFALIVIFLMWYFSGEDKPRKGAKIECSYCGEEIKKDSQVVRSRNGINYITHPYSKCVEGVMTGHRQDIGNVVNLNDTKTS
jgi:hypothetical protein